MRKNIVAYWFSDNGRVTNASGEHVFEVGKTYNVTGEIVPCQRGLHGSGHPADALLYAIGGHLDLVALSGTIVARGEPVDKYAASERKHLARIDATELLHDHARWCATQVLHLWNPPAPQIVVDYLATGRKNLRKAARSAVRAAADAAAWAAPDAAWAARSAVRAAADAAAWAAPDAAWDAARSASWAARSASWAARSAAWDAARSASWAARSASWAARSAAWDAARSASWAAQRKDLIARVEAAFKETPNAK